MIQKFADIKSQELYERLFNIYWDHFQNNSEEYCEKFVNIKQENRQSLQPEQTILGKIFSSQSYRFVDDGLEFEHIDIDLLNKNINSYLVVYEIPVKKNIKRQSIKEYSKKGKQIFKTEKDQKLYEDLYKLYCKKYEIDPSPNSVIYNALYDRCFHHVSTKSKHFNKHEIFKSDYAYMNIVLRELGFEPKRKQISESKIYPLFDVNYPFWSVPDLAIRVGFWFAIYSLFEALFQIKAPVWYFLTFLISQLLFFGIISMLFKNEKL